MTVPAGRYFYRRRGTLAGVGFPLVYWSALILAGLAVTRGNMTWPSILICATCGAIATGYSLYLATRRKDLRITPADDDAASEAQPEPLRTCPRCGVKIDARGRKCPVCEVRSTQD